MSKRELLNKVVQQMERMQYVIESLQTTTFRLRVENMKLRRKIEELKYR